MSPAGSTAGGLGGALARLPSAAWAVLGGGLWALCFGARGLWVAPWVALAPLFFLLGRRRAAGLVWLHGTAFWVASLYWIVPTLMTYGRVPTALSALALLLLAAFLSLLFWLPLGVLGPPLWRAGGGWPLFAGLPALWTALEWLREYVLSGFPWNLAAYAAVDVPGARSVASLVGSYGVSFLLVGTNVAVAVAVRRASWRPALGAAAAVGAALAVGVVVSPGPALGPGGEEFRLLQPNIPNLVEWDRDRVEANYRSALAQADAACEPGTLVILPESALWPYVYGREPRLAEDLGRLTARGCRIFLNSITELAPGGASTPDGAAPGSDTYYNSALLIGPAGVEGRYDKRHLVPFGEYVPFAGLFDWLDKLARMAGDFSAGSEPGLLAWGDERLAAAICYEVVYPANVALQVQAGATILVTVTNDAWYGDSTAPWQHLRAAQFRAAEHRRPLLRAAITGVSAVIAPDGSLVSSLGVGERGVLAARVRGRRDLTPYARAPWLVPLAATLLALAAYARVRSRRDGGLAEARRAR